MMHSQEQHFRVLLDRWLQNTASEQERKEFAGMVMGSADNQLLLAALAEEWKKEIEIPLPDGLRQKIVRIADDNINAIRPVHRVHFLRTAWFRVAVIILLFSSIGAYLWQTNRSNPAPTAETSAKAIQNEVMPGSDKAILTLSDGRKITLGSAAGKTITEGDLQIRNNNSELIYTASDVMVNNTMSTPKGGQYKLTLSDGTQVWLNAASSITYPTAFKGNTREVSITGEAYLDVKQDKQKPFIVKTKDQKIEVLGTAFNVNAYPDEITKTSLLNGSIKIDNTILKPAQAYSSGKIQMTNIEQDIAWKNGVFDFNGADVQKVMRQISRWYDIEIKYAGEIPKQRFVGELSRDLSLQQVLETMADLNIRFTLNNRTLTIK